MIDLCKYCHQKFMEAGYDYEPDTKDRRIAALEAENVRLNRAADFDDELVRKYQDTIKGQAAEIADRDALLDEAKTPLMAFARHCNATGYRDREAKNTYDLLGRIAKRKEK